MIIDYFADLITNLQKEHGMRKTGELFEKSKNWVKNVRCGCNFVMDTKLIAGLRNLGYDIQLVPYEKEDKND